MTRTEFLGELDGLLNLPKGKLTGDESLASLSEWDSLAVVSYLALVDEKFKMPLEIKKIEGCQTVNDLVDLVGSKLS